MLSEPEVTAERLAELCAAYGFDGWLINIEADVPPALLPALIEFLQLLTLCCKTRLGEHAQSVHHDRMYVERPIVFGFALSQNRLCHQSSLTAPSRCH